MNIEKYLLLNIKKLVIVILSFVLAVILHNVFYALFGFEEPVFFLLAVIVIPVYFVIMVFYTIFHHIRKRNLKKKK